jgi:hypothetical protein
VQVIESNASKIKFWLSEKDNGIYDAMNKATGHLNGNWVYFLGADDELFPEFSAMADELNDDSHIYYGSVLSNGKKQSGELSAYYMAKGGIYHQAIIYPREVFNRYKFELKYRIVADNVLNMTCYKDKDFEFEYKDHIIAKFNHLGTSGINVDTLFEKDKTRLIFKNFGYKIGFRYLFRLLKARLKR